MSPQARCARFCNKFSSGWARPGWAHPIYISRHPQPPAKYIGFSEISKVTNCYRMLLKIIVDGFRGLGYSGIMNKKQKA